MIAHVGSEPRNMDEEEVHIAVGKNSRKEKANILWAAANFPRATIVLVHVHWPSKWMPFSKIFIILQANHHPIFFSVVLNIKWHGPRIRYYKDYRLVLVDRRR